MATTDISLVNNVVKITPENGNARQFSLQPASYAFNERSELQLQIDGQGYLIALADLRISGSGSAPVSTAAALSSLSSTFPAWNQSAWTLNEVLAEGNDAGASKITNVADPEDDQDVVTKAYGDANYGGGGGSSYLVYTPSISQSGTDAPVATVFENTLGGAVTWARSQAGDYRGTTTIPESGVDLIHIDYYANSSGTGNGSVIPVMDYATVIGYLRVSIGANDGFIVIFIEVMDETFTYTDLAALIGNGNKFHLPSIKYFPA